MTIDLILDPQIRTWVLLPTALIAFLIDIIRHHFSILLDSKANTDLRQLRDHHLLKRARLLQCNYMYIPISSFRHRQHAFNNSSNGYLTEKRQSSVQAMSITDPRYVVEILKGNFFNVVSMLLVGGWITLMFSGFLTTKMPFPLTLTFQSMLQRGVELSDLEASWVSSGSWYFLNVFCLRGIYGLVFTGGRAEGFDVGLVGADMNAMMKEEWEGLEMVEHKWALEDIEKGFVKEARRKKE